MGVLDGVVVLLGMLGNNQSSTVPHWTSPVIILSTTLLKLILAFCPTLLALISFGVDECVAVGS